MPKNENSKLNIHQRINAAMLEIGPMTTDGRNTHQKYNFVSEQKITLNVHEQLVKHGIVVYPIDIDVNNIQGSKGVLCTIKTKYKFVNIDNATDFIEVTSCASDIDFAGAHVPKAMTMCYKFLWRQTFALACGDDPEKKRTSNLLGKVADVEVEPDDAGSDELF